MQPLGLGVATSAYQVEGAVDADGRGPSIWDVFCAQPGRVVDGSDGSAACGSYDRLDEDVALLRGLGVSAYRFSVSWPRVVPTGSGRVEPRGLAYYDRLVDALLDAGIRPMPTLYHWDLPQPLEDAGGWPVRDTAHRFAEYAGVVAARLGDRASVWSTMNEPWCSAFLGYAAGIHAPGRQEPSAAYAAAHHLLLAHALGRDAVRAAAPDAEVGVVLNLYPVVGEEGADPLAVDVLDAVQNRLWLDALADGTYPEVLPPALHEAVQDGDLDLVRGSVDWLGVNYYTVHRVAPAAAGPAREMFPSAPPYRLVTRGPVTAFGWEVVPDGLRQVLVRAAERLPGVPLRVTENGAAFPDDVRDEDGTVRDDDRVAFLRDHLEAVERARAEGVPVVDYLAWSLMDNFEWAEGYGKTFGIAERDRTPKASYRWYAERTRRAYA